MWTNGFSIEIDQYTVVKMYFNCFISYIHILLMIFTFWK